MFSSIQVGGDGYDGRVTLLRAPGGCPAELEDVFKAPIHCELRPIKHI